MNIIHANISTYLYMLGNGVICLHITSDSIRYNVATLQCKPINTFTQFTIYKNAIIRNMWSVLASNMGSTGAPKKISEKATLSSASTECFSSGSRMSVSCSRKCVRMVDVTEHSDNARTSSS